MAFVVQEPQPQRQGNLVLQLTGRSVSDIEKPQEVGFGRAGTAFDDVAGDGDGGPPHLRHQPKLFGFRELRRGLIDLERQGIRQFEGPQFAMVSHAVSLQTPDSGLQTMPDSLRKVRRGDPLEIPAETFNTFIDAARDFQNRTQNRQSTNTQELRQTGTLLVKNGSGQDRQRFEVLAIDRPIFLPSDSLWSFQDQVAVIGVVPDEDKHVGRFVVLLEPLRDGMIGRAVVSGVTPVRLNVLNEAHEWADIEDGETDSLKTDTAGSAFILWKEPAGSGGYGGYGYGYGYYGGLRWALVRIGNLSDGDQWGTV